MNYYVIEIQTYSDGNSGNFVFAFATKGEAEDKFIALRAYARQSTVHIHTVLWIDKFGDTIERVKYIHPIPEPEEVAE